MSKGMRIALLILAIPFGLMFTAVIMYLAEDEPKIEKTVTATGITCPFTLTLSADWVPEPKLGNQDWFEKLGGKAPGLSMLISEQDISFLSPAKNGYLIYDVRDAACDFVERGKLATADGKSIATAFGSCTFPGEPMRPRQYGYIAIIEEAAATPLVKIIGDDKTLVEAHISEVKKIAKSYRSIRECKAK